MGYFPFDYTEFIWLHQITLLVTTSDERSWRAIFRLFTPNLYDGYTCDGPSCLEHLDSTTLYSPFLLTGYDFINL